MPCSDVDGVMGVGTGTLAQFQISQCHRLDQHRSGVFTPPLFETPQQTPHSRIMDTNNLFVWTPQKLGCDQPQLVAIKNQCEIHRNPTYQKTILETIYPTLIPRQTCTQTNRENILFICKAVAGKSCFPRNLPVTAVLPQKYAKAGYPRKPERVPKRIPHSNHQDGGFPMRRCNCSSSWESKFCIIDALMNWLISSVRFGISPHARVFLTRIR